MNGTARMALVPHTASATPSAPPASASSTFSLSSAETMRQPSGAERDAHPDLALPRAGAREHQVGGVGADRQQNEQHDALQRRQRAGDHLLRPARRLPVGQHLRGHRGVGRRIGPRELPRHRPRRSACAWAGVTPGASRPITA